MTKLRSSAIPRGGGVLVSDTLKSSCAISHVLLRMQNNVLPAMDRRERYLVLRPYYFPGLGARWEHELAAGYRRSWHCVRYPVVLLIIITLLISVWTCVKFIFIEQ